MTAEGLGAAGEPAYGLSRRVSAGAAWVVAATVGAKGLQGIGDIVLARLLAPEHFGVMAIALALVAVTEGATATGFESALIQRQDRPEDYLDTAWTFELVRYAGLFGLLFVAAPAIATFFEAPDAELVFKVVALSFLFQGARNIGVVFFKKRLEFHKQFVLEIVPACVYLLVAIVLAILWRNVWALAWAVVARRAVACATSFVLHPYRPRLSVSLERARTLFSFGKWILGSSILVMFRAQGMSLFVGKLFGMALLGFFNRAEAFTTLLFAQLNEVVWKVGYSAFALLQREPERLREVYLKTATLLTFIGFPIAAGMFVLSEDLVRLLLTPKWLPAVPLMRIFCIQGMLSFANTAPAILFQAVGRPAVGTKATLAAIGVLLVLIYPASVRFGMVGAAGALLAGTVFTSPILWGMGARIAGCSIGDYLRPIGVGAVSTAVMAVVVGWARSIAATVQIGHLLGLVLLGAGAYLLVAWTAERYLGYRGITLLQERVGALRR